MVWINWRISEEKCRGPGAIQIRMIIGTPRRIHITQFIFCILCVFEDTDHPEIFIERLVDSRIFWDDQKVITKVGLEQPTHLS